MVVSTWAWVVTSRAVVGSSKTITLGRLASAMAIATRCCWPPESWRRRKARSEGSSTSAIISERRASRSALEAPKECASKISSSWVPMRRAGFKAAEASWGT